MSTFAPDLVQPRAETRTRLLPPAGVASTLAAHHARYGHLPALRGEGAALIAAVEAAGLRGRGGAGVPTHRKLRAVAAGREPIVVANGFEGELASHKDTLLMRINPHLVLDGLVAAGAAVGAKRLVIAIGRNATSAQASIATAIAEREAAGERPGIELVAAPDRFVAGEETALVSWLNGKPAKPAFTPPRPFARGVAGRPTLVQNVETLDGIALIARTGPQAFRELGTHDEHGSMLVALGGAVGRPGVAELEIGTTVREALERCDGLGERPRALLVGGYGVEAARETGELVLPLDLRPLREVGVGGQRLGAAREARDRGERGARPGAAEHGRHEDAAGADHEQDPQRLAQRAVDLRQRTRDLRGATRAAPDGEHAQMHALHGESEKKLPLPEAASSFVRSLTGRRVAAVVAESKTPLGERYCTLPAASPNGLGGGESPSPLPLPLPLSGRPWLPPGCPRSNASGVARSRRI